LTGISPPKEVGTDVGCHPRRIFPKTAPSLFDLGVYLTLLLLDLTFNLFPHDGDLSLPLIVRRGLLLLQQSVALSARLPQRILIARQTLFNSMYRLARFARTSARAFFTLAQDSTHGSEQKPVQDEHHCDNDRNMNYQRAIWYQLYSFGEG
jgi:hypothetical protein